MLTEQTTEDNSPSVATKWPLSHVRQNFGKLNVAPQFSQEDLVPVDVLDADEINSDLEEEEDKEEECQQHGQPATKQDPKEVLKCLEDKIAKYKRFLDKAKAKKFSAIRYAWIAP